MLVRFNIDFENVVSDIGQSPAYADAWLQDFYEFWQCHGILSECSEDSCFEAAEQLMDSELSDRVVVQALIHALIEDNTELHRRVIFGSDMNFGDILSCGDLVSYQRRLTLLLLGEKQVAELRTCESMACVHCKEIEIIPWQYSRSSCVVRNIPRDWTIPVGYTGRQIWNERFHSYVRFANEIVLVDLYTIDEHNLPALAKFLKWTSDAAHQVRKPDVKIFTTVKNLSPKTIKDVNASFLNYYVEKYRLNSVTFFVFDRNDTRLKLPNSMSIDRWVRFGEIITFKLHGIRILEEQVTPGENCDLQNLDVSEKLIAIENSWDRRKDKYTIML